MSYGIVARDLLRWRNGHFIGGEGRGLNSATDEEGFVGSYNGRSQTLIRGERRSCVRW